MTLKKKFCPTVASAPWNCITFLLYIFCIIKNCRDIACTHKKKTHSVYIHYILCLVSLNGVTVTHLPFLKNAALRLATHFT